VDLSFGGLLLAVIVGAVGFAVFRYGRKQGRLPHVVAGVGLMVYPYFVPNPWIAAAIAVGVLAGLWVAVRAGA
jgi:hypothetical protein